MLTLMLGFLNNCRVALTPVVTSILAKKGFQIRVEHGAGALAKFRDAEYEAQGAKVTDFKGVFDAGNGLCSCLSICCNVQKGFARYICYVLLQILS